MWSPANKYALPSKEERVQATKAILDLRAEIVGTEEHLVQAQLRLANLRRQLNEREAWLAAIRKLSHDELAIIFNMCAEDDWMTPMRLAGVCRTWRYAVLATHRAWSFIDLKDKYALDLLPLFLERSGQRAFHVGLDEDATDEAYAAVIRMADRIQCLAIPEITSRLSQAIFPILTQLFLYHEPRPLSLSLLKRSQFPSICHLNITHTSKSDLRIPDKVVECPVIQTLMIFGPGALDFFHIVRNFGKYLKELRVFIPGGTFFSNQYIIYLPQLEILSLYDWRTKEDSIMCTMITPQLKTLLIAIPFLPPSFPLQMDLGFLVHMRVYGVQKPPLWAIRGLKVLQLDYYSFSYVALREPLLHDSSICPNLEIVEIFEHWVDETYSDVQKMVSQISRSRGGDIKLFSVEERQFVPPLGYDHPCGDDMPCDV